jgi:lysophospholipase L1-like esterase
VRITLFGDSIAAGLGTRGRSYGRLMADRLGAELVDYSATARDVRQSLCLAEDMVPSDLVLIAHGITEAIIRPKPRTLRYMPRRWRALGWMDPRPYYSARLRKRLFQRLESAVRWRAKVQLLRFGGYRLDDPATYAATLLALVDRCQATRIVILGPPSVDPRFFPGSPVSYAAFADAGRRMAEVAAVEYYDLTDVCGEWADYLLDHFHPSTQGHQRIATAVLRRLLDADPSPRLGLQLHLGDPSAWVGTDEAGAS